MRKRVRKVTRERDNDHRFIHSNLTRENPSWILKMQLFKKANLSRKLVAFIKKAQLITVFIILCPTSSYY